MESLAASNHTFLLPCWLLVLHTPSFHATVDFTALCLVAVLCCAVQQAFEELVLKILETPGLVNAALGSGGVKLNQQAQQQASTCSC